MATGERLLQALESAVRALDARGLRHALIGGAALPVWGRIRATADADLLMSATGSNPQEVIDALRQAGFAHMERADRRRLGDKLVLHFWFPLRDLGLSLRVDVIASEAPWIEEVLQRAVLRRVDGFEVRVASCEDLILLKLEAGRAIDLADARELCAINMAQLDRAYLEGRADARGLRTALAETLP